MIFKSDYWEDIRRAFKGSYIKFPSAGDEIFYVDKVDVNGLSGVSDSPNPNERAWMYSFENGDQDIEFVFPLKSYFLYKNTPHFLHRIPARQYRKGITSENTAIYTLGYEGFQGNSICLPTLTAYVSKPAFQGFKFTESDSGYVVSSRIAVSPSGKIYVDLICIGKILVESETIALSYDIFLPEIEAILKEHGLTDVKVVCNTPSSKKKVANRLKDPVVVVNLNTSNWASAPLEAHFQANPEQPTMFQHEN